MKKMKVYIPEKDINLFKYASNEIEIQPLEQHDTEVILEALKRVKEKLLHYKPQIVDDIGLCVSATILDFFEHIPEELREELEGK